jgi:hypothetical protein
MGQEDFSRDLELAQKEYPFLEIEPTEIKAYPFKLEDDFEITDHEGNHYGTFRASVHFPSTYPKGFPVMFDMSEKFPWEDDWHMSPRNGECCVCGVIEKEEVGQKGITVLEFIQKYVIRFYANQVYRETYGHYKNGEYAHYGEGIWEALEEEFNTKDRVRIRRFLGEMRTKRGRNDDCFCGSGKKYKKCHWGREKFIIKATKGIL